MLTIAIPTYNRASTLPTLLDSIFSQIGDCEAGSVHVVVSDNASTDSTRQLVESYSERNPGIVSYFCNEKNFGYSRNVDLAVRRSGDDFVLLMSDDDALEEGALAKIASIIGEHGDDADLIFVSALPYDVDLAVPSRARRIDGGERFFSDGRDYLRHTRAFPPALLSGYVVRKSSWENMGHADLHTKSIIVHMLVAMEICFAGRGVVVPSCDLVKYRQDNILTSATWDSHPLFPFVFWLDCLQGLKDSEDRSPYTLRRWLYSSSIRTIVYFLVRQKITLHKFAKKEFYEWFGRVADWFSPYTWMVYFVRNTPRVILKFCLGWFIRRHLVFPLPPEA